MNPQIKEIYDLFSREVCEAFLSEIKELELILEKAYQDREELEGYLTERKYRELQEYVF
jgi:hypothetical protein